MTPIALISGWPPSSFNPHTHEGCDYAGNLFRCIFKSFNPHTHEGCDQSDWKLTTHRTQFQSTHPRRVWPASRRAVSDNHQVSIHTPTKGVTEKLDFNAVQYQFQSTHPRRVWPYHIPHSPYPIRVSIHTPTKGVTILTHSVNLLVYSFNPHTHEGCDRLMAASFFTCLCFNPHTHEGCDWSLLGWYNHSPCFNPHTHEGCD